MLSPRFLALPVIALTVLVALSQAHSGAPASDATTRTVYRAVNCALPPMDAACSIADSAGATIVR
ncbi:MAG: hypothetical protein ACRECO_15040 [Xanthobacteraceae bacterium]